MNAICIEIQTIKSMLLDKFLNDIKMMNYFLVLLLIPILLDIVFQVFIEIKAHQTVEQSLFQLLLTFFHFSDHFIVLVELFLYVRDTIL